MALTKISTGGVKDDAASQAKIADEAVDEARLQVSNAGTNGQFLQKQSGDTGGLTWATVTVPDTDKIEEGDTSIETIDTGTNGHVIVTANGTERLRIVSDGKWGLNGSNWGNSGQVLTSQGTGGAVQWADSGGAWEVISSTLLSGSLPTTGGYAYVENKGWSNSYARYKVTLDGINRESPGGGQQLFKLWIDWYKDSSNLFSGSAFKAKGTLIGGSNFTNGDSTKWGPCNDANAYRMSGDITIPMFNSGSEDINKHMWATWMLDDEMYMERCYYDHNNQTSTDHITGIRIRFVHGNNDLNGRITFLRQKYS